MSRGLASPIHDAVDRAVSSPTPSRYTKNSNIVTTKFSKIDNQPNSSTYSTGVSRSCPDLLYTRLLRGASASRGSLPDRLETDTLYGAVPAHWRGQATTAAASASLAGTPNTPPPSPGAISAEENLVLISVAMNEPCGGGGGDEAAGGRRRKTVSVDFNCLDLVVSVESWMVVLDFLGIGSPSADLVTGAAGGGGGGGASSVDGRGGAADELQQSEELELPEHSDTEIEINSLTLVLTQPEREIARANVSNASMHIVKVINWMHGFVFYNARNNIVVGKFNLSVLSILQ